MTVTYYINHWIKKEIVNWKDFDDMLNQGFCADLADNIYEMFGKEHKIVFHNSDFLVHTWIECEGKHYDLQNPEGVKNWQDLKYFKETPL